MANAQPQGKFTVLTVTRHEDALPAYAALVAAGVDAKVVDDTDRRPHRHLPILLPLPGLLVATHFDPRPVGPYRLVVPLADVGRARQLLMRKALLPTPS